MHPHLLPHPLCLPEVVAAPDAHRSLLQDGGYGTRSLACKMTHEVNSRFALDGRVMCKLRPTLTDRLILAACLTGVRSTCVAPSAVMPEAETMSKLHRELPCSWTRAGLLRHSFVSH